MNSEQIELWTTRAKIAERDPWWWLKYFVFTKDEHDKSVRRKPFPPKAIYRVLCRVWRQYQEIFIDKSRQLMITWFFVAMYLHDSLFNYNRRNFFQSKKQEDANAILDRARFIYDGVMELIEPVIGTWLPRVKKVGEKSGSNDRMVFLEVDSIIQAIPQGDDVIPSYTLSGLFSDETSLQPRFEAGYAAAMPAIDRDARFTGVGTSYGNTAAYRIMYCMDEKTRRIKGPNQIDTRTIKRNIFEPPPNSLPANLTPEQLAEARRLWIENKILSLSDEEFDAIPILDLIASTPGIEHWITFEGTSCFSVHYTADPEKDPATEKGRQWVPEAKRRMKSAVRWEQHMEMNHNVSEGRPVISNWDKTIFVPRTTGQEPCYHDDLPLHISFDFGTICCGCAIAQKVPVEEFNMSQLQILDEIILWGSHTPALAEAVVKKLESEFIRSWQNNDIFAYCDPNGNRQEATTSDRSLNSHVKILEAVGIYPDSFPFGVPESTEFMETMFYLKLPDGRPMVILSEQCSYLIQVLGGGLVYPESGKPGYYDKDGQNDHGGDIVRYLINNVFDETDIEGAEVIESDYVRMPIRQTVGQYSSGRVTGYKTIPTGPVKAFNPRQDRFGRRLTEPRQKTRSARRLLTSRYNYVS
ncbi:MAG: hypothetical protein PHF37_06505 [Phycisphaerae bacterium]|nr:hypothetical protein [Phycisphaerae bacterium]